LNSAGIVARVVHQPQSSENDAQAAALLLLSQDDPPTALLCFSDVMANGVVRAAEASGLRVPEDVAVIGFDDQANAELMDLSTVHQPVAEQALDITVRLLAAIVNGDADCATVVLPTELVVRGSTETARSGY